MQGTLALHPRGQTEEGEQRVQEHSRLVQAIARRIHHRLPQHVELDDLIQAGMVGLLDAADRYDAGREIDFEHYARHRIRGAIFDSLRELDWSPRWLRRKQREVNDAIRRAEHRLGRSAGEEEIAAEMGLSPEEYLQLLGRLHGLEVRSLEEGQLEESASWLDSLAAPGDDPLTEFERRQEVERLAEALMHLPVRQQQVLSLYYREGLKMREIAQVMDVVESRVSQLRSAALRRLRELLTPPTLPRRRPVQRLKVTKVIRRTGR